VVERSGRRSKGGRAFVRQVCWRDYYAQVNAAHPEKAWEDYKDLGDSWSEGGEGLRAWREGRTGYPLVDAAMRQLLAEGWMHNRARLLVASFLTRDLYVDWKAGARHFLAHLIDGDLASNNWNWQRQAGTGTVAQKNRVYSPARQAERFDPDGDYVRRYVPELRAVEGSGVHAPWELDEDVRVALDYPERIVEHAEAVEAFRAARGLD
jgi:deoxyribodipyrimidine photo-lyase